MKQTVSIQTRLILALLIVLPVVWLATSIVAATELYENINELYDTQMSQLARRLLTLPASHHKAKLMNLDDLVDHEDNAGEAEDKYMAFMLWDAQGKIYCERVAIVWRITLNYKVFSPSKARKMTLMLIVKTHLVFIKEKFHSMSKKITGGFYISQTHAQVFR